MGKPTIRFEGYTDDWEQRKLGELGSLKNGMNFSKEAMGIGFPFVNLQNIFGNNVIDVTNLGKAMAFDSQLKDYNLLNGDVLFVRSSVKLEGVGEAALVPQNLENTTYSGFIIRFRDEYGLDNNFKRFLFGIESVRNQIMAQATNSANKNISQTVLENLCLKIPNKSEQEKIGLYFSDIDHLITLHHRKCEETKKLKKFMLQKMFPKKGEKVPDIRFDGFTDDWEQRKVSEIAIEKLSNGIMNNQSDDETGVKHINVINMYDTDKIHPEKLTFSNYDEEAVKKCNVEFGDIFLTRSSLKPEGIAEANVLLDSGRFVYDDHLIRLKVNKEKYDPFFVKLNLSGNAFKRQFIVRAKTTAFTTIGQEDISECLGFFPKKEEQQQIGEYFMTLDHLITLHQHKCEELQNIKKFMLQNMFT